MELLFISTTLQLYSATLSNDFYSESSDSYYSLSEMEFKEYLLNQPDLHINCVAYRLLNPEYYIWLRSKINDVVKLYQQSKVPLAIAQEVGETWKVIHSYAVENLDSKRVKDCQDDIKLQIENNCYNYIVPQYDPYLESSPTQLRKNQTTLVNEAANAQNGQIKTIPECPNCKTALAIDFDCINITYYSCTDCQYYLHLPKGFDSTGKPKYVDNFANTKSYMTIEYDAATGLDSSVLTLSKERSDAQSSPENSSFSRNSSSGVAASLPGGVGGEGILSDGRNLDNLKWSEMLNIFQSLLNNERLQKDKKLYLAVLGYKGFINPVNPEKPNISNQVGLLGFLKGARDVIKVLVKRRYLVETLIK